MTYEHPLTDPETRKLIIESNRKIVQEYESIVINRNPRSPSREEELAYWSAKNLLDTHECLEATQRGVSLEEMAKLLEAANRSHLKRAEAHWEGLHYVHEQTYQAALDSGNVQRDLLEKLHARVLLSHSKMEKLEQRLHGKNANQYGHVGQVAPKKS